jgi:hypothetical protein
MTVTRKRSQIGKAQRSKPWGVPLLWMAWRMGKLPKRKRTARTVHYLLGDEEIGEQA